VASRKKKSKQNAVQMVAGVATMGMPAPVQKVASSKIGSLLLLGAAVVAAATGAITISFKGGLPSVTVNEVRTQEIRQHVEAQARMAVGRIAEERRPQGDVR
jgi:hypothetical protein